MAAHLWQAASYKSISSKLKTARIILSTGVLDRDDIFMYIHTGRLMPAIAKTVGSTGDHQDRIFPSNRKWWVGCWCDKAALAKWYTYAVGIYSCCWLMQVESSSCSTTKQRPPKMLALPDVPPHMPHLDLTAKPKLTWALILIKRKWALINKPAFC